MLALSPPLFSSTCGWPLEDLITQNVPHDCMEANSYNSLLDFHKNDQVKHDFSQENSFSSCGAANSGTGDDMMVSKRINHNASERDRRKRVNELYAFLRSLLPMSSDQKKKVSIPGTVSHALKYIPELQKEVENLRRKKDKLSSCEQFAIKKRSAGDAIIKSKTSFVSSVTNLGDKEAVIQLISSTDHMSKNKEICYLSKVLEYLEDTEYELLLINMSTFLCFGEGRLLSTLHLQVQGDYKIESEKLKENLWAFYQ